MFGEIIPRGSLLDLHFKVGLERWRSQQFIPRGSILLPERSPVDQYCERANHPQRVNIFRRIIPSRCHQSNAMWGEKESKIYSNRMCFFRIFFRTFSEKIAYQVIIVMYNTIMTKHRPTHEAYGELQKAYDFYNRKLFGGKLPDCLITMQRKRHTYGYFAGDRWRSADQTGIADEIALNPEHFAPRTTEEVLSTLVHEMVHLKQHHFGKPGRGRYHNKQWAEMMDLVGLCPSDTGEPGGHRTGDHMSHYIVDGGRFDVVTQELLKSGFVLSWEDRYFVPRSRRSKQAGQESGSDEIQVDREDGFGELPEPPQRTREKYSCPKCGLNAWAKFDISLTCTTCKKEMKVSK